MFATVNAPQVRIWSPVTQRQRRKGTQQPILTHGQRQRLSVEPETLEAGHRHLLITQKEPVSGHMQYARAMSTSLNKMAHGSASE